MTWNEDLTAAVSQALRAQRRVHRLDQRSLAGRAGVSKSTVARLERGDDRVTLVTLTKVLAEVGLELLLADGGGERWQQGNVLPVDAAGALDRGGRRFPAHLPAIASNGLQSWDFARDRRYPTRPRTPWRYDRWSDEIDVMVDEMCLTEPDATGPDATGPDATGPGATGADAAGPGATGAEAASPDSWGAVGARGAGPAGPAPL